MKTFKVMFGRNTANQLAPVERYSKYWILYENQILSRNSFWMRICSKEPNPTDQLIL